MLHRNFAWLAVVAVMVGCSGGGDEGGAGGTSSTSSGGGSTATATDDSSASTDSAEPMESAAAEPAAESKPEESASETAQPAATTRSEDQGGLGKVVGTIKVTGMPPELAPLVKQGDSTAKDAATCAETDVPNQSLVVGEGNTLANVFVYLARAPKGVDIPDPAAEPIVFDQKNCTFIPHCLTVRSGQKVKVINSDPIAHNVHTNPAYTTPVNSILQANDSEGMEIEYLRQETVPVKVVCDIHAWMSAYHLPVDHPFAAVTDENGKFEIAGLPPGTHKFRVWHETGGNLERGYEVEIKANQVAEIELSYGADKFAQ